MPKTPAARNLARLASRPAVPLSPTTQTCSTNDRTAAFDRRRSRCSPQRPVGSRTTTGSGGQPQARAERKAADPQQDRRCGCNSTAPGSRLPHTRRSRAGGWASTVEAKVATTACLTGFFRGSTRSLSPRPGSGIEPTIDGASRSRPPLGLPSWSSRGRWRHDPQAHDPGFAQQGGPRWRRQPNAVESQRFDECQRLARECRARRKRRLVSNTILFVILASLSRIASILDVAVVQPSWRWGFLSHLAQFFAASHKTPSGQCHEIPDDADEDLHVRRFIIENELHWLS